MSDNPFLAGLALSNRFTCPAAVEAYTLAKLSGPTTLSVVGTADADADVAGIFLGARRAGDNQGIPVCVQRGVLVPLLNDGADPLAVDDRVSVSTVTAGRVGVSATGGIGRVVVGCPAVADAIVLVLFEGDMDGTPAAVVDLQEAYDNGNQIDCAAAQPVIITADPTNFDALEVKDGSTTVGTISGFAGGGGLAVYGSKDDGARVICRDQTGASTGATALVVAGRGGPTAGTGGRATLAGGNGGTTDGAGGEARVAGGIGQGTAAGGIATVTGGGNGGTGAGGDATVTGGASTGASGAGGNAALTGGASAGGAGGDVSVNAGAGTNDASDGDVEIGVANTKNTTVEAGTLLALSAPEVTLTYAGNTSNALRIVVNRTDLRGANSNDNAISLGTTSFPNGPPAVGFLGASPSAQTVAALTNNVTAGGTDDQVTDWTDLTTYATDAAAIRNAVYQLARKVAQLQTALDNYGLV